MIYNLFTLLESAFPSERFFINNSDVITPGVIIPDRCVKIREFTGITSRWHKVARQTIQFICRDVDPVKCRQLAFDIYNFLDNRFGLALPAVTVAGDIFPELKVAQISAIGRPQSIGNDESGRSEFSTNFEFIFTE